MGTSLGFPLPGFLTTPRWNNRWFLGTADDTRVNYSDTGHLQLHKATDAVRQLVLQASPADFQEISRDEGVTLGEDRSYAIGLNADTRGSLKVQLVIHEFDSGGKRLARWTVDNRQRAAYVADAAAVSLIASLRAVGQGQLTVRTLELSPVVNSTAREAGVHVVGRVAIDTTPKEVAQEERLALVLPVRRALNNAEPLSAIMNADEALIIAERFVSWRYMLEAQTIVSEFDLHPALSRKSLRKLFSYGRKTGYAQHALACINEIFFRTGSEKEARAASNWRLEWEFYRDPWALLDKFSATPSHDPQGPILHMVGKSLPATQTGYTLRTKYTVDALRSSGVKSVIAVQAAGNHPSGLLEPAETELNGTKIFEFAGRPAKETNRQIWLQTNAEQLLSLVERLKPRAIHAHSDFTNGVLATHVADATGVPVVYESRGFWEETWLSRIAALHGWGDLDHTIKMYGYPDLYIARRNNERKVRERADRVVTLARTMKDFILSESPGMTEDNVHLASNAVHAGDFPKEALSSDLREVLRIDSHEVVIGYISSMVEYEGIETLIDAYKRVKQCAPSVRLLLVGDGDHLEVLREYAKRAGLNDILFTGRVPHQEIINYYHTIDIFVVPRRRTRVTELVTPLKPFEAFSTGRAVVLSDVAALKEISNDAKFAARTFPADDDVALAAVLEKLVEDPHMRERMGDHGAEWVREYRTWESNVPTYQMVYEELQDSSK